MGRGWTGKARQIGLIWPIVESHHRTTVISESGPRGTIADVGYTSVHNPDAPIGSCGHRHSTEAMLAFAAVTQPIRILPSDQDAMAPAGDSDGRIRGDLASSWYLQSHLHPSSGGVDGRSNVAAYFWAQVSTLVQLAPRLRLPAAVGGNERGRRCDLLLTRYPPSSFLAGRKVLRTPCVLKG